MILLQTGLLVRDVRVTVENERTMPGVFCFLYTSGIFVFRAVITKDHGEVFPEECNPQSIHKPFDRVYDFSPRAAPQQDDDHERAAAEQDCQKTLSTTSVSGCFSR